MRTHHLAAVYLLLLRPRGVLTGHGPCMYPRLLVCLGNPCNNKFRELGDELAAEVERQGGKPIFACTPVIRCVTGPHPARALCPMHAHQPQTFHSPGYRSLVTFVLPLHVNVLNVLVVLVLVLVLVLLVHLWDQIAKTHLESTCCAI